MIYGKVIEIKEVIEIKSKFDSGLPMIDAESFRMLLLHENSGLHTVLNCVLNVSYETSMPAGPYQTKSKSNRDKKSDGRNNAIDFIK